LLPEREGGFKTADISQDQRALSLFFGPVAAAAPGFLRVRWNRWLIIWWKNSKNSDGWEEEERLRPA